MSIGIELLLCEDPQLAQEYAQQLDDFNKDRKSIEQGMQREALRSIGYARSPAAAPAG